MGVERMNVAQRLGPYRHAGEGHTWIDGCVFSSRIHALSPGQRSLTKQRHYCIINNIIAYLAVLKPLAKSNYL